MMESALYIVGNGDARNQAVISKAKAPNIREKSRWITRVLPYQLIASITDRLIDSQVRILTDI